MSDDSTLSDAPEAPTPEAPMQDPAQASSDAASLAPAADQNGTAIPQTAYAPEFDAMVKAWLRDNIGWVQTEMDLVRTGTQAADRVQLNP